VRAPVGIAVVIRAGEADRATTLRDSARGKKLLEGGRARKTGRWLVFVYGVERGHVQRRHGGVEQREPAWGRRREGKGWSPIGGVELGND
jgi:hypothetical protein